MKPYGREEAEAELEAALEQHHLVAVYRAAEALDRMAPKRPPSMLGVALWYASVGLRVFPLMPGSKLPFRHTKGVHDATTNPVTIRRVFSPQANVGIATGHGLDVIDFDGPEGHEAWTRRWPGDNPEDPPTGDDAWALAGVRVLGSVSTPRAGGLHIYVKSNGRGNRAAILGKGSHVDYRGLGGYVVAPPSVTPDGAYVWARSLNLKMLADAVRRHG